jgi:SAM-dependent methyltransferase
MPITAPFETHTDRYDDWFDRHPAAYESELAALRAELPPVDPPDAVEIGVGTGRFAAPLDVGLGVDPSPAMLARAADRGVTPIRGVAEALPLHQDAVELAVLVTTICFVDDLDRTLAEAARALRPGGTLLVGFVDRDSPLGERYREKQAENPFYRDATFVSVPELLDGIDRAGFEPPSVTQTLFADPAALDGPDRVEDGWGEGSFVAVAASTPAD